MKIKVIIPMLIFMLLATFGTTDAFASWVKLNVSDLIQSSDVILLGKIVGTVGESKGVADGITGWVNLLAHRSVLLS